MVELAKKIKDTCIRLVTQRKSIRLITPDPDKQILTHYMLEYLLNHNDRIQNAQGWFFLGRGYHEKYRLGICLWLP
jgi:hypothetical protein